MGVIKVDNPIQMPIKMFVTLCSLMPKNWGFSPGAELSDSFFNDCKWLMDKTVAENYIMKKRELNQMNLLTNLLQTKVDQKLNKWQWWLPRQGDPNGSLHLSEEDTLSCSQLQP